jgi:DNA-binding GntR family transcriptional regulator
MTLDELQPRTMPDGIAEVLRRAILGGRLKPGEPLRETRLSAELGVSRGPLREALRILEEQGLVDRRAFKGVSVATMSSHDIEQIAVVRRHVEPLAVELGLERLRENDAGTLQAALSELHRATAVNDVPGSIDAHLAFHRLLYVSSQNAPLMEMWRSWESRLQLYWVADHQSFATLTDVAERHARLVELIAAGKMGAIRKELQQHVHGAVPARP